jgi:pilus assembly protein CpaF
MTGIRDLSRSARELLLRDGSLTPEKALEKIFDERSIDGSPVSDETAASDAAFARLTGFGALQPYLDRRDVEELWMNKPNELFVATPEGTSRVDLSLDEDDLKNIVLRMLRLSGRRVDSSTPFTDAALPDGSRLHVVIPDVTAKHWSVNIRKFPTRTLTLNDLSRSKSVTTQQLKVLRKAVSQGSNVLISGATHSGKTTLLCALIAELPADTRLVTCEETFEIRTELQDWVAMQTRSASLEGGGEVKLRRLVKEALRMRPGYLVIGEVREAESLDMLIAMNSGISGACTIHANSAQAALTKLCTLPLLAGPNISSDFVRQTAAQAVDLVVHCSYSAERGRWISEICSVDVDQTGNLVAVSVKS